MIHPIAEYGLSKAEQVERQQEALLDLANQIGSIATLSRAAFASFARRLPTDPETLRAMRIDELLYTLEGWQEWMRSILPAEPLPQITNKKETP